MNSTEHLLACLGEEGVEIAKDCLKSKRFGLHDVNILVPDGPDNVQRIIDELNDLMGVIRLCVIGGILPSNWASEEKQIAKMEKVLRFMDYAENSGALQIEQRQKDHLRDAVFSIKLQEDR